MTAFLRNFGVRLVLTLVATLAFVGGVQYLLLSRDAESRLVSAGLERHEVSARQVAQAFATIENGEAPLREAQKAIDAIRRSPGIEEVALVDYRGEVLAGDPEAIGTRDHTAPIEAAVAHGDHYAGDGHTRDGQDTFQYVVPVEVAIGRLALQVDEDRDSFSAQLASLRWQIMRSMLIGLLLGLPLAYALGGAALTRRHRRAVERSTRDALTELGNQRAFQREIGRAVAHSQRTGEPLALAVLDVDFFKRENDDLGHQHGDRVLQGIGDLLREGRESDCAFRIGGDEFALLMPDTDLDGALLAAERVRAAATRMPVPVTLSLGVAELWLGADPTELVRAADEALYAAKRGGRNAVAAAPPPPQAAAAA